MGRHSSPIDQPQFLPELLPEVPVSPRTFGAAAINLATEVGYQRLAEMHSPDAEVSNTTPASTKLYKEVVRDLVKIRGEISRATPHQRAQLEPYIRDVMGREFPTDGPAVSAVTWLTKKADNLQFFKFLERHVSIIAELQNSPHIAEAIETKKTKLSSQLEAGMHGKEPWVSKNAKRAIDRMQNMRVTVGDIWSTHMEYMDGYHMYGSDEVVIAQGTALSRRDREKEYLDRLDHILGHEFNHAIFDDPRLPTWIREGMAHHVAVSLEHGKPGMIDPAQRSPEDNLYAPYRSLMHTVLTRGVVSIDPRACTRAYTSGSIDTSEWRGFERQVDHAWGAPNVLHKISEYSAGLERALATEHPDWVQFKVESEAASLTEKALATKPELVLGSKHVQAERLRVSA